MPALARTIAMISPRADRGADPAPSAGADPSVSDEVCRRGGEAQLRPCHPGIGSAGVIVAVAAGSTTVGVRLRFCTTTAPILLL